jgi:hypothetical protein
MISKNKVVENCAVTLLGIFERLGSGKLEPVTVIRGMQKVLNNLLWWETQRCCRLVQQAGDNDLAKQLLESA